MAVKYPDGGDSSLIIGTSGGEITDRSQMERVAYAVQDWNVNETASFEEDPAVRASLAPNPPGPARYGVSGSFRISVFLSKMLGIFKALTGDTNAASVAVTDKTLVPSGTNVTDVVTADYFSDTTAEAVNIVDDQNLAGQGNKTIVDNLRGYNEELTLTVTPDNAATLTNTGTPGTVKITYIQADGTTRMTTLSFADSAKTDAQTTQLPLGAYITQVRTTGFSAGTFDITAQVARNKIRNPRLNESGRLRFQFSEQNAGGTIKIRGLRKGGLLAKHVFRHSEEINLSETASATTDVTSTKYFHQIRAIEVLDSTGAAVSSGTVEITAQPGKYVTTYQLKQTEIQKLTAEAELAGIPHKITNLILASGTLNVAAGGNNIELNVLAERMEEFQSIESHIADEQFRSTRSQHASEFPLIDPDFFPGFGGYLLLDGKPLLTRGATANFGFNRVESDAIQGGAFSDDFEDQGREISVTLPTYYQTGDMPSDKFVRWQDTLRNQVPVRAQVFLYTSSRDGQEYLLEIEFPYALLTAPVTKNISGRGRVPIDVSLGAFPDPDADDPPDVIIRVTSPDTL